MVWTALTMAALTAVTPAEATEAGSRAADAPLEVIVVADPYARWRDTRWRVDIQVGLPIPAALYAEKNGELPFHAYDLSAVIHCDLAAKLGPKRQEVMCDVEDGSVAVTPWGRTLPRHAEEVLAETDERLDRLMFRLQVTEDGKVTNIGLAGEPEKNRRTSIQYENLRQMVSRAFVGFHLEAPKQIAAGEVFYEKHSRLFSLPSFRWMPVGWSGGQTSSVLDSLGLDGGGGDQGGLTGGNEDAGRTSVSEVQAFPEADEFVRAPTATGQPRHPFDAFLANASIGHSIIAHRLDIYEGRYLVQSHGEGLVDIGEHTRATFQGELDAVSVFDPRTGVMTERVWTLKLDPTASSALADGFAGWPYWHHGRIQQLGPKDMSSVGPSRIVTDPEARERGALTPALR